MKKVFTFITVFVLLLVSGCSKQVDNDIDKLPEQPPAESVTTEPTVNNEENPFLFAPEEGFMGIEFDFDEKGKLMQYDTSDIQKWTKKDFNTHAEVLIPEYSFSYLLEKVGTDGLVVAGHAIGERMGVDPRVLEEEYSFVSCPFTITSFQIEKIFMGNTTKSTVSIREDYGPSVTSASKYEILYSGTKTRLVNGQRVLLFLEKDTRYPDLYRPIYWQIPLQNDYLNYSEETLTSILDFYRGEEEVYKYGDRMIPMGETVDENGVVTYLASPATPRWEKSDLSNEEMLEKFSDNILIQSAATFKINLWPIDHVNYVDMNPPVETLKGYRRWSSASPDAYKLDRTY